MESLFAGVESAQPKAERLPTLTKGTYTLQTILNRVLTTLSGKALLREFKIIESTGPDALPVGTEAKAKLLYLSEKFIESRIAEHACALTGSQKVDAAVCDAIYGENNPMAGKMIKVTIEDAMSEANKPYLRYSWRHVPEPEFKPAGKKK